MSLSERIPAMGDADLVSLQANAQRLETTAGTPAGRQAATDILPVIAAELAARETRKPAKPAPKPRVKKAVAAAA